MFFFTVRAEKGFARTLKKQSWKSWKRLSGSWTQLNFEGKPVVNAWDRLGVGDKFAAVVPGRVGGHVPDRSAAHENQALW